MVRIQLTLFKRTPLNDPRFADSYFDVIDQSNFRPDRFNDCEPVRKRWGDRDLFRQLWMEQTGRFYGDVLTHKKTKPKIHSSVTFLYGPREKCHMISFYEMETEKAGPNAADDLLVVGDRLFQSLELDYGFACTDDEYTASNIYKDFLRSDGLIQNVKVVGMEWPDCIPGLFSVNYFGEEYFKQGMPRFAPSPNCVPLSNGVRFMKSNGYLDWESGSSTLETRRLIKEIGSDWFFTKEAGMPASSLQTDKSLFRYPPGFKIP